MTSNFLQQLGLGGVDIGYILLGMCIGILVLLIFVIVQFVKLGKLKKRYEKFMRGKNASSLEKEIGDIFQDIKQMKIGIDKNNKDIRILYKNAESAIQKVGIVKYDAFQNMGGKLSFSLCMLDENNNGFIMNSVHSSDGCYSYTKEIKEGKCKIELGKEEQIAFNRAMNEEAEK